MLSNYRYLWNIFIIGNITKNQLGNYLTDYDLTI